MLPVQCVFVRVRIDSVPPFATDCRGLWRSAILRSIYLPSILLAYHRSLRHVSVLLAPGLCLRTVAAKVFICYVCLFVCFVGYLPPSADGVIVPAVEGLHHPRRQAHLTAQL